MIASARSRSAVETAAGGRIASSRLSMPQSPQPVGPAISRRRVASAADRDVGEPHAQLDADLLLDHLQRVSIFARLERQSLRSG